MSMAERDQLILALVAQGWRYPAIAHHVGLTAARICQIVKLHRALSAA
jgi:hypothetical protein